VEDHQVKMDHNLVLQPLLIQILVVAPDAAGTVLNKTAQAQVDQELL
jgi:hypothetical protein